MTFDALKRKIFDKNYIYFVLRLSSSKTVIKIRLTFKETICYMNK